MKIKGLRWIILGMIMLVSIINYFDRGTLTYMWVANQKSVYTVEQTSVDALTGNYLFTTP